MYHILNIMYIMYVQEREREKKKQEEHGLLRGLLPYRDVSLIFGPGRYC